MMHAELELLPNDELELEEPELGMDGGADLEEVDELDDPELAMAEEADLDEPEFALGEEVLEDEDDEFAVMAIGPGGCNCK